MEEISRINLVQIVMATIQTNEENLVQIVMPTIQTNEESEEVGARTRRGQLVRKFVADTE